MNAKLLVPTGLARATGGAVPPHAWAGCPARELVSYRRDPVGYLWRRYQAFGRVFRADIGSPTVFLVGPDANRFLLRDHAESFSVADAWPSYLRSMLSDEALSMKDGDEYLRVRALLAGMFGSAMLKRAVDLVSVMTGELLDEWVESGPVEVHHAVRPLIIDVAAEWLLGPAGSSAEHSWRRRCIDVFSCVPVSRHTLGVPHSSLLVQLERQEKRAARQHLERYLGRVVHSRRRHPRDDAVTLLCDRRGPTGQALSDDAIVAQLLMLLSGGTGTLAATIAWLVAALDEHPHVLSTLRDEVDRSLGPDGPRWADLRRLPYLSTVVLEAERRYSVSVAPARVACEDVEFDGFDLPAGTLVRYVIPLTHLMPEVFADPTAFDPDRFAPARAEDKHTDFSLVGFGAGPRHCLGKPFARAFLQTFLAVFAQRLDLAVARGQDLRPLLDNHTTLRPASGVWAEFAYRPRRSVRDSRLEVMR